MIVLPKPWRERLHEQIENLELRDLAKSYDLDKVAVTADLTARSVRYVFPKCGAWRVTSDHSDKPNVWADITGVIADKYNILCTYLRKRGGLSRRSSRPCANRSAPAPSLTKESFEKSFDELKRQKQEVGQFMDVSVEPARPCGESLFSPVPVAEMRRQVLAQPARQRKLLRSVVADWRAGLPAGRRADSSDLELAQELVHEAARVLRLKRALEVDLDAIRKIQSQRKWLLYFSTGAPVDQYHQDEDVAVRLLVQQAADHNGWDLYDADLETSATSGQKLAYLASADAALFVIVRPRVARNGNAHRAWGGSALVDASLCRYVNDVCNSLLLIDTDDKPPSWGEVPHPPELGKVRYYRWTDEMSQTLRCGPPHTGPQHPWDDPEGLPTQLGTWLDKLAP